MLGIGVQRPPHDSPRTFVIQSILKSLTNFFHWLGLILGYRGAETPHEGPIPTLFGSQGTITFLTNYTTFGNQALFTQNLFTRVRWIEHLRTILEIDVLPTILHPLPRERIEPPSLYLQHNTWTTKLTRRERERFWFGLGELKTFGIEPKAFPLKEGHSTYRVLPSFYNWPSFYNCPLLTKVE